MECIENSPHPLVFKVENHPNFLFAAGNEGKRLQYRTATRALKGMQKEALVSDGSNAICWRLVCDEGPWLNGTDLAPFPLGYFAAGLVASYMTEFLTHARQADIEVHELQVMVDNLYAMEGSLLRGTMVGSALPVEATFNVRTGAVDKDQVRRLAQLAVSSSPVDAYLRNAVTSRFSLNHNGVQVPVSDVTATPGPQHPDPADLYARARPTTDKISDDIVRRLDGEVCLGGEKLGTERCSAVGLTDQQKRQVHVRGVGVLRRDGLKEIRVACFNPVGSVFRFLSDESGAAGGEGRAPDAMVYMSAGLSFCFATQLGRYAHMAKHDMQAYRIVQDTSFSPPAKLNSMREAATGATVDTDVYVTNNQSREDTRMLVRMGEQTCYLHAACRAASKTRIKLA